MADIARLNAQRGGNRAAATRAINKITDILADATQSRLQKIHELTRKLANLEAKFAMIEGFETNIFEESKVAGLQVVIDNADQHNQVVRDAIDNFMFQMNTLQAAEDTANAALVLPVPAPGTTAPSASALPKLEQPIFKGDILL